MARSSILGGQRAPERAPGHDTDRLGPSDSSDSGSDMPHDPAGDSNTDRFGTGERAGVEPGAAPDGADILPDHLEQDVERIAADSEDGEDGEDGENDEAPPEDVAR